MPFAARYNDMHTCPMSDGPKPHVGGPILPGSNTSVLIEGLPASVVGDTCVCAGPPDTIVQGSSSVLISGSSAARMGDATAHGGSIIIGSTTVIIGG